MNKDEEENLESFDLPYMALKKEASKILKEMFSEKDYPKEKP